jgi:hypothetical protein
MFLRSSQLYLIFLSRVAAFPLRTGGGWVGNIIYCCVRKFFFPDLADSTGIIHVIVCFFGSTNEILDFVQYL